MMFTDLPYDLESEILSRVPAPSLRRLQSTCKRWYALLKDSRFIKQNLAKAAKQHSCLMFTRFRAFPVSINDRNRIKPCTGFRFAKLVISQISHCDGLLLCTTEDDGLFMWNPCTSQSKWIQPNKLQRWTPQCFLGYDKSCHSYKILRFSCHDKGKEPPVAKFEIYEFNTNSWRVLDDDVTHHWRMSSSNGVTFKGDIYCCANIIEPYVTFMIKFDFATERFERMYLPFQSEFYGDEPVVLSVVKEEKLALLRHDFLDSELKIWVANTKIGDAKDLSWSEFLVVDPKNIITWTCISRYISFFVDEEKKMVVYSDTFMDDEYKSTIYVVGEDLHKEVYREIEEGAEDYAPFLVVYAPSLVEIPAKSS